VDRLIEFATPDVDRPVLGSVIRWMTAPVLSTFHATGMPHAWPTIVPLDVKSGFTA
jgi:hypothetical protein